MITIALSIHAFSGSMGQIGQLSWFQNSPPEEDSSQPAAPPANDRLFRQRPFGFNTNSLLLYHCNSPQPSSIFSLTFKCRPSHPVSFEPSVHLAGVRTDAVIGFLCRWPRWITRPVRAFQASTQVLATNAPYTSTCLRSSIFEVGSDEIRR